MGQCGRALWEKKRLRSKRDPQLTSNTPRPLSTPTDPTTTTPPIVPQFDDLHTSGIYQWAYLYELGRHKLSRLRCYIRELRARGLSRDPPRRGVRTQRAAQAGQQGQQQPQQRGQEQQPASAAGSLSSGGARSPT